MCRTMIRRHLLPIAAAALLLTGCGNGAFALSNSVPRSEQAVCVNDTDTDGTYDEAVYGGRRYAACGMTGNDTKPAADGSAKRRIRKTDPQGNIPAIMRISLFFTEPQIRLGKKEIPPSVSKVFIMKYGTRKERK